MPHSATSDLGMHSLLMSHKKDARLIWVKVTTFDLHCILKLVIHTLQKFCGTILGIFFQLKTYFHVPYPNKNALVY